MKLNDFVVANLSDMDFHYILCDSLVAICRRVSVEDGWTEESLKKAVVLHMVGLSMCRDSLKQRFDKDGCNYPSLNTYFTERLTITFTNKKPDPDNGGGSAYYDSHLGEGFAF